jgi:quercetin dioxygenase-like cupin family protein
MFNRRRRLGYAAMLALSVATWSIALGFAAPEEKSPVKKPTIDAAALATMLQNFDKVEVQEYPWGWIRWLMSSKLDPDAKMTFGVVEVRAGQSNPPHIHPNCEEVLYVLSGSCEHRIADKTLVLKAGDVLRIPAGVPHAARTFEKEAMRAVIVYSSGDRQFVEVDEDGS